MLAIFVGTYLIQENMKPGGGIKKMQHHYTYIANIPNLIIINLTLFSSYPSLLEHNSGQNMGECSLDFSIYPKKQDTPPLVGS